MLTLLHTAAPHCKPACAIPWRTGPSLCGNLPLTCAVVTRPVSTTLRICPAKKKVGSRMGRRPCSLPEDSSLGGWGRGGVPLRGSGEEAHGGSGGETGGT